MNKVRKLPTSPDSQKERWVNKVIIGISVVVPLLVALLLLFPDFFSVPMGIDRGTLPAFHAIINGSTAILLLVAFGMIRKGKIAAHRNVMITAFGLSAIFLLSYVTSKLNAGSVHYGGEGWLRPLYFFILISHVLLSIAVLPLAMFAIYRGVAGQVDRHKKIVRWAFPIWLYVAVTGVLVYLFMQPYY